MPLVRPVFSSSADFPNGNHVFTVVIPPSGGLETKEQTFKDMKSSITLDPSFVSIPPSFTTPAGEVEAQCARSMTFSVGPLRLQ
jgi:hypothetical protein